MPFCCFEAFSGKSIDNFLFRIKSDSSETSTEILRKFVFLTMFETANPDENLDLFKHLFLIKPVKDNNY